jgi:hypothetical protein
MAADAVLASLIKIEIYDTDELVDDYVEIQGLDTVTPQHSTTDADVSVKEITWGAPNYYQLARTLPARRARAWQLEGKYLVDSVTHARDAGQELMEEAGALTNTDAIYQFRFSPAGGIASDPDGEPPVVGDEIEFLGTVTLGDVGGGDKDEAAGWSATIRYYSELPEEA